MRKIKYYIISLFIAGGLSLAFTAVPAGAEELLDPCRDPKASSSPICPSSNEKRNPLVGPQGILTSATRLLSILVGIAAVIMIVLAGLKFVTSGDNPQEVSKAREMVIYAVIGIIVAASAQLIVIFFLNKIT